MEFVKNNTAYEVVKTSSCNHKCGGDCTGQSDHVAQQKGSSRKSS